MQSLAHSSADRAFERLARLVVRFRWAIVAVWLAAAVTTSIALPSLSSQVNDDNSAFLPASAPSTKAAALAAPLLGTVGRSSQIVVVASRTGGLTRADDAAIGREATAIRGLAHVSSVRVVGLSSDGAAAELRVRVDVNRQDISLQKSIVASLEGTFARAGAPPGLELHLAGAVATAVDNQTSSGRSSGRVQSLSLLFIVVLLIVVFRSLFAALVTLLPSALALIVSTNVVGELGAHGLRISSVTQVLLIVLLLGAGTDYGLFLVFRTREALRDGLAPHEAVTRALVRVGESISASAGTVILALLTLLFAGLGLYHDLAVPLAVGMAVMLAVGLTLLPALLAILGRAAFWPSRVTPGRQSGGVWSRVAGRLVERPALTLGIGVVLFLALAAAALGYSSSGFGGASNAPAGSDAAAGNAVLQAHFPQSSTNPANLVLGYARPVWSDPAGIARAQDRLRASGEFTQLSGPLNATGTTLTPAQYAGLHRRLGDPSRLPVLEPAGLGVPRLEYDAYRASAQYVSGDGRVVQFEAALAAGTQQSTAAMNATPRVRATLARVARAAGADASGVAGEAAASYDISTTADHDLRLIVPIAVLAIGLLLALVLRSLVAPIYLIVSVVLSYLAALGLATLVFVDVAGQNGITFFLPFLMFIFLLALGEDYNILVMTRIREEARQRPLREAVVHAIGRTGSTVTAAGLILGGTFAVLGLSASGSESSQLQAIGFGLAAGILMDTFLVRTLLVPSIVILLGRWNWWPSRADRTVAATARPAAVIGAPDASEAGA
jgi:putative drug exporter of the RND superfamily